MEEHAIVSFSSSDWDESDARAPIFQLRWVAMVTSGLKPDILEVEAFTEERFVENPRRLRLSAQAPW
jgi:hypothetical protein